ncbi:MAG: NAD(P)H-hydrate dehydratase [Lachnospiraceae bacterium]|jgi:yjeF C-terminal region, hydroxyethylthiazole kinase-related|nr:NAD(P)H-hydrate dehydratase [Lachnospiraceae bacterium]
MKKDAYEKTGKEILDCLPKRMERSNKGTYGKVLCVAGSVNMAGAAFLCAWAAYRAGAGLVRVLTPEENRVIVQTLLPEALLTTFDTGNPDGERIREAFEWADVAAVGPGLGKEPWAYELTKRALMDVQKPLVLDADGLNHLSEHKELLKGQDRELILTPHPGEFARLTGQTVPEILLDIPGQAVRFARENRCICVLKDAPSAVGDPEGNGYINTTGNHGMSTGGSGDVLTGIIAGLLAQKVPALLAARLGVWLHGRAGDLAVRTEGTYGMLARHLVEYLPKAMMPFQSKEQKGQV